MITEISAMKTSERCALLPSLRVRKALLPGKPLTAPPHTSRGARSDSTFVVRS
jgi:hypothetical protein